MNAASGVFAHHERHHRGWFRIFRFGGGVEVWFGDHWFMVSR